VQVALSSTSDTTSCAWWIGSRAGCESRMLARMFTAKREQQVPVVAYDQYEPAWDELAGRRPAPDGTARQQSPGAGSSTRTLRVEDNVVTYPGHQGLPPGRVFGPQPPPLPQNSQEAQTPATMECTTVVGLVKEAIENADNNRAWYDTRASSAKKMSRRLWFGAIAFGLLGGLCQLLPDSVFGTVLTRFFGQLVGGASFSAELVKEASRSGTGLVFFLLSGACLLIDQVFAYTSSAMRFRLIELKLGKLIRMFALNVECELARCGGRILPWDRADGILRDLEVFVARVEDINIEDTETWIAEVKAGLLQIEQLGRGSGKSGAGQKGQFGAGQ
jgi:hypothetical protein